MAYSLQNKDGKFYSLASNGDVVLSAAKKELTDGLDDNGDKLVFSGKLKKIPRYIYYTQGAQGYCKITLERDGKKIPGRLDYSSVADTPESFMAKFLED